VDVVKVTLTERAVDAIVTAMGMTPAEVAEVGIDFCHVGGPFSFSVRKEIVAEMVDIKIVKTGLSE
jgi:hypothetical protein